MIPGAEPDPAGALLVDHGGFVQLILFIEAELRLDAVGVFHRQSLRVEPAAHDPLGFFPGAAAPGDGDLHAVPVPGLHVQIRPAGPIGADPSRSRILSGFFRLLRGFGGGGGSGGLFADGGAFRGRYGLLFPASGKSQQRAQGKQQRDRSLHFGRISFI